MTLLIFIKCVGSPSPSDRPSLVAPLGTIWRLQDTRRSTDAAPVSAGRLLFRSTARSHTLCPTDHATQSARRYKATSCHHVPIEARLPSTVPGRRFRPGARSPRWLLSRLFESEAEGSVRHC